MVTKKTTSKVVLKEENSDEIVETQVNIEVPAEKTNAPVEKLEPVKADLSNLTVSALKSIATDVFTRLKATPEATEAFGMLAQAGALLKLEPYELGKGAEYTREYLKRVLEKVNGR